MDNMDSKEYKILRAAVGDFIYDACKLRERMIEMILWTAPCLDEPFSEAQNDEKFEKDSVLNYFSYTYQEKKLKDEFIRFRKINFLKERDYSAMLN